MNKMDKVVACAMMQETTRKFDASFIFVNGNTIKRYVRMI